MRILYLADIRFPLERANGIQSMETCHALAARGHEVTLVVRPDTHTPARDPFAFYGPRIAGLQIEVAPITGPAASRRVGYLTFAIGRAMGRTRQDLIFTRDLGLASLLLRVPAAVRAPVVYEAHGIAADVAAALPGLLTGAPEASPAKLRRLARRDAHVWRAADGYVTITDGLARELTARFGERPRIAVVPDGAGPRRARILQPRIPRITRIKGQPRMARITRINGQPRITEYGPRIISSRSATLAICIRGKASISSSRRWRRCRIRGG